jgi:universal stress protein A
MTRQVVTLAPTVSAHEAARLVWQGQTTCCLVVQEGQLLGIVTTTDLLDLFIDLITGQLPATYEHILVPIDFIPAAAPAIDAALALARGQRARITLIHVLPRLNSTLSADMDHVSAEVITQLTEECRTDVLRRLATLIPPAVKVPVDWQVVEGEPATAIVETANHLKADLIVMGRRNRHGLRRLFIPSVARQVVRCAPCPVLVVEGTGAWLSRKPVPVLIRN